LNAAAFAISSIVSASGFTASIYPMHPRSCPFFLSVTNAPRGSFMIGEVEGAIEGVAPLHSASIVFRARVRRYILSSRVSSPPARELAAFGAWGSGEEACGSADAPRDFDPVFDPALSLIIAAET
jgi:hypothetical protein